MTLNEVLQTSQEIWPWNFSDYLHEILWSKRLRIDWSDFVEGGRIGLGFTG